MPNKHKTERESWISIVVTVLFILGFLALANSGAIITGFTAAEQPATIEFEVNSVIPATAILEISSGTQKTEIPLSEFTIKLSELQSLRPVFENNSLIAYSIANITIDLAEYSIQPADSISIKFLEVYKEITRETVTQRITKEENITKEIIAVTENITEISEENLTAEPIIPEKIAEIAPIENVTIAEITKEPEFIQPAEEFEFRIAQSVFTENWDDGSDVGWTDDRGFYAVNTTQKRSGSYSEAFSGNSDGAALLTIDAAIDLTGKTNGNVSYWAYILAAVDATEECCLDLSSDGTNWNAGAAGTSACANGQAGTGAQEAVWISASRVLNSSYYNSNFKIRFNCDSNAAGEPIFMDDIDVSAEVPNNAPIVRIYAPANNTWNLSHSANFTYNVTDADANSNGVIVNCTLLLQKAGNWQYNTSNKSAVAELVNQTINITLEHASINWTVQCMDGGNLKANATIFNYTVFDAIPTVSAVFPANNTWNLSHYINFTYNVTSRDTVNNCSLLLQKAGDWKYNESTSAVTKNVNQTINITLAHESINWTVQCENTYNEKANATIRNFTVYDSTPAVSLVLPLNNTYQTTSLYTNFTYNVTSKDSAITCDLYVNDILNSTDTAITKAVNQTFNLSFADYQNLNWSVGCNSTYNEYANSTIRNYSLLSSPPIVRIYAPANNTWNLSHSANFTYNVTDADANSNGVIVNCTLLLQKAGNWQYNTSNKSAVAELVNQTINITLEHASINWTIQCEDGGNLKANATIYNYTVYDATPAVSLVLPFNNTYQIGSKFVNFTYNVTSKDSAIACDLYVNDILNSTDTTIARNVNQTFNLSFADYQNLNWSVGCNNSFNEYVNSAIRNYSLLEISNQAPDIPSSNISVYSPSAPSVILDDKRVVSFTFVVSDPDGLTGIKVYANLTGENDTANYIERNITCEALAWSNTTAQQYNCSFDIWYWYKAGSWNVSMNATDGEYWVHNNASSFNLGSTTGIVISPANISWGSLNLGDTNQTSTSDPILVNNTGNYNVSVNKVNVTGYDLLGETALEEYIPSVNFSIDTNTGGDACSGAACFECNGTKIVNITSTDIARSMLSRGNHSINDGSTAQEQLYVCLRQVPISALLAQAYSTKYSGQWVIGVS